MPNEVIPRIGQWLYASCSDAYYGEVVGVGQDSNGAPTIDIRIEDPEDLIWCEDEGFENPLTTIELLDGVRPILRDVQYRFQVGSGFIVCNTPGNGCYRCTKLFRLDDERTWASWPANDVT